MYALFKNRAYVMDGDADTLRPCGANPPPTAIAIPWGDEDLVVDPTDHQLAGAGFFPADEAVRIFTASAKT